MKMEPLVNFLSNPSASCVYYVSPSIKLRSVKYVTQVLTTTVEELDKHKALLQRSTTTSKTEFESFRCLNWNRLYGRHNWDEASGVVFG